MMNNMELQPCSLKYKINKKKYNRKYNKKKNSKKQLKIINKQNKSNPNNENDCQNLYTIIYVFT